MSIVPRFAVVPALFCAMSSLAGAAASADSSPPAPLPSARIASSSSGPPVSALSILPSVLADFERRPDSWPLARRVADLLKAAAVSRTPDGADLFATACERLDRRLDVSRRLPPALYVRGVAAKMTGDYPEAVRRLEESAAEGADAWDVYEELVPYYRSPAELTRAAEAFAALSARRPADALLHQARGYIFFWMDDYGPAEKCLRRALALEEASGRDDLRVSGLYCLSYLQMYINRYAEAVATIERSIALARRIADRRGEIQGRELLAFIRIESGRYREALDLCSEAEAAAVRESDPSLETICRRTLGVARMELGDLAAAEADLEFSLERYGRFGEERRRGVVLYWLSLLRGQKGDYSGALDAARDGLAVAQRLGFRTAEVFHLASIGQFYHAMGQDERSLAYSKKALLMSQKYVGKWSQEECLNSIGVVYMERGLYREALEYFKLGLSHIRRISHLREEPRCLYNVGLAYYQLGMPGQARDYFERALREAERTGQRTVRGMTLNRLGDLALLEGDRSRSRDSYRAAARIGAETAHPPIRWQSAAGLGALLETEGSPLEAAALYREAVAVIEEQRRGIYESELNAGFFKSGLPVYESLVNLYFEMDRSSPGRGYDQDCFFWAEKARSRALLDDLYAARIDPGMAAGTPEERRGIRMSSGAISRLLTEISRPGADPKAKPALWEALEREEESLQAAIEAVRKKNPGLFGIVRPEPLRADAVRSRVLVPGRGLLEFLAGERHLFVFALTTDGLRVHRLDGDDSRAVRDRARNYSRLAASPGITAEDCAPAARKLFESLLRPVWDRVGGLEHLVVVPDQELCLIPFEALVCGPGPARRGRGRLEYLLDRMDVTYAPSGSALAGILDRDRRRVRQDRPKGLLAIADPVYGGSSDPSRALRPGRDALAERFSFDPIPFSRSEVEGIGRFVRARRRDVLLGTAATEDNLKAASLADYRIVHFATHSLLDERVASRSALVLTQDADPREDGFLQVREIYERSVPADLVVLSACRTGGGKMVKGESVQGLAQAFVCAGASSVVVSLWPVGDRATSRLMRAFYRNLSRGSTVQDALRRAKRAIRGSGGAPLSAWSGFVLIGGGDRPIPLEKPTAWERAAFWRR